MALLWLVCLFVCLFKKDVSSANSWYGKEGVQFQQCFFNVYFLFA